MSTFPPRSKQSMTNYLLYSSLVTLMYNVEDSALTASSSAPDSFPHYAKLVDLSSFARKGIKTTKMERIEQIQRPTDHIGESCCNLENVFILVFQMPGSPSGLTTSNGSKLTLAPRLLSMESSCQGPLRRRPM